MAVPVPLRPERPAPAIDWREVGLLAGLLVPIVLLWGTWIVWPLKILVVFFHELSHALAALATGGRVLRIEVVAAQGGLAVTAGGSRFLILTAGYLGSLGWGALALLAAVRSRKDRALAAALGVIILLATLAWVRPLLGFGFGFHLLAGAGLLACAAWLPEAGCDAVLKLFGLTSCLYVIPDIYSDTIARSSCCSDARALAGMTGIPTVAWGALWIVLALGVLLLVFRIAFTRRPGRVEHGPVDPRMGGGTLRR